jgi:hypothetical protein
MSLLLCLFLSTSFAFNRDYLETEEFRNYETGIQEAILAVIENEEVANFLEANPSWSANAYADSETQWHVDFYDGDDWIGNAHVDFATAEIYEIYLLQELSQEAYQAGKEKIETLVFNDAEVQAILGDVNSWGYDLSFNKWEQRWEMTFWRGIDAVAISFWEENGNFNIEDIYDPQAFSEQEQRDLERNQAIELAYSAEGIDQALEGVYDWRTYAEPQGGTLWGVEFTAEGRLFYAVVDIASQEILDTRAR